MPGKTSGFFRFFRLQRKTKTESFCRNMCAAKIHRPAHRGAHASDDVGPQQKPSFCRKRKNKRSGIRFHHRQKRMTRNLF